jgi:hypothetical protein
MTRHGGAVRLRSTPGEGTEVHLSMPVDGLADELPQPEKVQHEKAQPEKAQQERLQPAESEQEEAKR